MNAQTPRPSKGGQPPLALILGIQNPVISDSEFAFFRAANPYGLFLGRRNMRDPQTARALCQRFREAVGREDAPVLTDQEGGRVSHLDAAAWPRFRPFSQFGRLAEVAGREVAENALRISTLAMGQMMRDVGLDSGCTPVLDLMLPGADPVIGERAFSSDPELVAKLGAVVNKAMLDVGVLPVTKHIPGHGRATEDSHKTRPVVEASPEELDETDFVPFKALNDAPWAMVAHVVYTAFDPDRPATVSPVITHDVIRGRLGFNGVLVSDCVFMNSLEGPVHGRVTQVLDGGCDIALHCHGHLPDMQKAAEAARPLTEESIGRIEAANAKRGTTKVDIAELHREVETIFRVAGI